MNAISLALGQSCYSGTKYPKKNSVIRFSRAESSNVFICDRFRAFVRRCKKSLTAVSKVWGSAAAAVATTTAAAAAAATAAAAAVATTAGVPDSDETGRIQNSKLCSNISQTGFWNVEKIATFILF